MGLSMLFYPDIASWWNGRSQRGMVVLYDEEVARLSQEQIDAQFRRAGEVNAELSQLPPTSPLLVAQMAPIPDDYREILYVGGIMGRVEIPQIGVNIPILHTTLSSALDIGAGHLEGTAFPIGGESTHSAITAHTGLANARMFTDLEYNIGIGDYFFISILGRRLAYQVEQIDRVLPHEIELLRVVPGEDLLTLITCTPYAINSHRLLVRGRRTEYILNMAEEIEQTRIARRVDLRIYIFVGLFLMFMLAFAIYSAIRGNEITGSKRLRVTPPATPTSDIEGASGPDNRHIAEDLHNDMENPAIYSSRDIYSNFNPKCGIEIAMASESDSIENDKNRHYQLNALYMHEASNRAVPELETYKYIHEDDEVRLPGKEDVNNKKQNTKPLKPAFFGKSRHGKKRTARKPIPKITRNIAACFIAMLILAGTGAAIAQALNQSDRNGQTAISDFVARMDSHQTEYRDRWVAEQLGRWIEGSELTMLDTEASENPLSRLYNRVKEHNRHLYESGHRNLPDPFDYNQDTHNLSYFGFEPEEMIGFVTIPSIEAELPIFMGASQENLHRGLAHVTDTSLPVGGVNTNAVIAGHIGLRRANILDNIGDINIGDEIHITNFYETITYAVTYIHQGGQVPYHALTIQSGQDLLTLLGYRHGSADGYVVIAKRIY